jgi:hypothetical protein
LAYAVHRTFTNLKVCHRNKYVPLTLSINTHHTIIQQVAPERADAEQFYDEITSLAKDLRRELQPINNDYQSLFNRFTNIMSTYAQRVTLRLGDAFKDTQSVDGGIRSFFTGTAAELVL